MFGLYHSREPSRSKPTIVEHSEWRYASALPGNRGARQGRLSMNAKKLLLIGAVAAFGVLAPVAASADDLYVNTSVPTTTKPTVEGTILTRTSDGPKASVLGSTQTRAPGGLPVTGG